MKWWQREIVDSSQNRKRVILIAVGLSLIFSILMSTCEGLAQTTLGGATEIGPADTTSTFYSAKRVVLLMGSRFDFGAYAKTQAAADSAVAAGIAEVKRIEALISSWQPTSQTSAVNAAAGGDAVTVDRELLELVRRGLRISELTGGAFDLTAGGLRGLYRFVGQDNTLPAPQVLA